MAVVRGLGGNECSSETEVFEGILNVRLCEEEI